MNDVTEKITQTAVMTDFSSQIYIAIVGACIWYLIQILLEHYRVNTSICNKFDVALKRFVTWFHTRKNDEYRNDLIDDIGIGKTIWEKLKIFFGSFFPVDPPSNIPDLKEHGTSGELEAKKQASTEEKTLIE